MVAIEGSFFGEVIAQTALAIPDQPDHVLMLAAVSGQHTSDDPNWNRATLTYWGSGDLVTGDGPQSGYFRNQHEDGGTTFGKFDGRVTLIGTQSRVEGTWQLAGGTGKFDGVSGGGKFSARSTSLTTVQMNWNGEYTLK